MHHYSSPFWGTAVNYNFFPEFIAPRDDVLTKVLTNQATKILTNQATDDYLDMLYSDGLLPLITKPTRITSHSATLIDHIYTNTSIDTVTPGILTMEISDHLPTFCIIDTVIIGPMVNKYFRDYSHFD